MAASVDTRDRVLIYLPLAAMGIALLWDWILLLHGYTRDYDVELWFYSAQRLVEGHLQWTTEFEENKLLVNQFLFYIPAWLDSIRAWQLLNLAAGLAGACAIYHLVRSIFSASRGFSRDLGHYTGLYSGAFTLYLTACFAQDQTTSFATSLSMVAAALCQLALQPAAKHKAALTVLAGSIASIAVGVRPHLLLFVAIIPAWLMVAAQLEQLAKIDHRAVIKRLLWWNMLLAALLLGVNVLPYAVAGELDAFLAGMSILVQSPVKAGIASMLLHELGAVLKRDALYILLFLLHGVCVSCILLRGIPPPHDFQGDRLRSCCAGRGGAGFGPSHHLG